MMESRASGVLDSYGDAGDSSCVDLTHTPRSPPFIAVPVQLSYKRDFFSVLTRVLGQKVCHTTHHHYYHHQKVSGPLLRSRGQTDVQGKDPNAHHTYLEPAEQQLTCRSARYKASMTAIGDFANTRPTLPARMSVDHIGGTPPRSVQLRSRPRSW